jgi:hypothetical protein
MWITWLLLVALSVGLVIFNIISLLRIKARRTASPGVEEWSPGQKRLMTFLNLFGAIGVIIIWFALVYVLIYTGGQHLTQPWRNKTQLWAVPYALLYTSLFLGFMRPGFCGPHRFWSPSSRLWFRFFIVAAFFVACLASIIDLYLPPPAGSRQVSALFMKNEGLEKSYSRAFVPVRDFWP